MPTTWAFRLSNLGRSSWRAATSRVQVGVKAPMKPKSTTCFFPTKSERDSFSCDGQGEVRRLVADPERGDRRRRADHDERGEQEERSTT